MKTEEIKNKILNRRTSNKRRAELLRQYACIVYEKQYQLCKQLANDSIKKSITREYSL